LNSNGESTMKRFLFNHLTNFRAAAGTSCRPPAQLVISSLAIIVAMVGTIGFARAADELPSQDQALAQALENHPEIVAAKAKVALVEAELYGKRMEVSRQVLGLYGSLKTLDAEVSEAKGSLAQSRTELERTKEAAAGGQANQSTREKVAAAVETAERKLVVATGQREQAERELRLLIGTPPGAKETRSPNAAAIPARQAPQGLMVGNWKVIAEQPIKFSFTETPLVDVVKYLTDNTGIKFSVQGPALEVAGVGMDMPISLSIKGVPLGAALQGFEDAYPELQFVLRDYGVLLTTKEYAQEHGYMPALEFGKEAPGAKSR
jgi:hypothetical protein